MRRDDERTLALFTKKLAHPHDRIGLFRVSRDREISLHKPRMNRTGSLQLLSANFGKRYENRFPNGTLAFIECSFLHFASAEEKDNVWPNQ